MLRELARRIALFLHRDRATAELEEEMRLHRELRATALQRLGLTPANAQVHARQQFGNPLSMQEASRDMWGFGTLEDWTQDIRYAARRLIQRPAFSLSVITVLGLGIGATTAMFSAVDAAILRPLPFTRPDELMVLPNVGVPFDAGPSVTRVGVTLPDLADAAAMHDVFSATAAYASGGLNLSDPERPEHLAVGVVTTNLFATLGTHAALGRLFAPNEGHPNGPRVAILSHRFWQRRFGGRDMINQNIQLNDSAYRVIGVMPDGFSFPSESDLWIPMSVPNTWATFEPFRGFLSSTVIARRVPGVDAATATRRMQMRWDQALTSLPPAGPFNEIIVAEIRAGGAAVTLQQQLVGDRRSGLLVLLGTTGMLLLIGCANVSNLMLAQTSARRRELAVRAVLGATRGRVVRQLLAESISLALVAAFCGLLLTPVLLSVVRTMLPTALSGVAAATMDFRVLGFAAVAGLVTGIAFGLLPAFGSGGQSFTAMIKSGGGHGTTSGHAYGRRALVVVELALTVMLLVGAGLMVRSFQRVLQAPRGMNPSHAASVEMAFARGGQRERIATMQAMLVQLQRMPGIIAAGFVNDLPLANDGGTAGDVTADGMVPPKPGRLPNMARHLVATGGYFPALQIPLLHGRLLNAADEAINTHVAVISALMAERYWPGVDPLGRTFHLMGDTTANVVVGVVADVRQSVLDEPPLPEMYFPVGTDLPTSVALVVRTTLTPAASLAALQRAVHDVDPAQAIFHSQLMDDVVTNSISNRRTSTLLIAFFAVLALVLATLGVYAVVAFGVAQRARELGIRSALGATSQQLAMMISREIATIGAIGVAAGLAGSWALARVLASMVFDLDVHDVGTFVAVPILPLLAIAVATIPPALRAGRANPAAVMRTE